MFELSQKLDEKKSAEGHWIVYQTVDFGHVLTLDKKVILSEQDGFFYHEMMTHPALFTHQLPQTVAIVGFHHGVLTEVLKHPAIQQVVCAGKRGDIDEMVARYFPSCQLPQNERIHYQNDLQKNAAAFDIIIDNSLMGPFSPDNYARYHAALKPDGMLVQTCNTSLFDIAALKTLFQQTTQGGFADWQLLNFPQPSHPAGWRTILLATKHPTFRRIREKDVYNRTFNTRYYNFDTHKAALALPEFVLDELQKDMI